MSHEEHITSLANTRHEGIVRPRSSLHPTLPLDPFITRVSRQSLQSLIRGLFSQPCCWYLVRQLTPIDLLDLIASSWMEIHRHVLLLLLSRLGVADLLLLFLTSSECVTLELNEWLLVVGQRRYELS